MSISVLEPIRHDGILELRLARPPVNALDPVLVRALREAIEAAPAHGAHALLLSGRPGMFSAGLDVPTLLAFDRDAMSEFWGGFFDLCAALARAPIPVAAAITGHSPAGGAVLAMLCDYRVMARGAFRIGLNEVQVGLTVPECLQVALRRLVGTYRAERLLVSGTMLEPDAALAVGLVDELAEPDAVIPNALAWLDGLLRLPRGAMQSTRTLARADLAAVFADPASLPIADFLDGWFSAETQATLHGLVERLKKRD